MTKQPQFKAHLPLKHSSSKRTGWKSSRSFGRLSCVNPRAVPLNPAGTGTYVCSPGSLANWRLGLDCDSETLSKTPSSVSLSKKKEKKQRLEVACWGWNPHSTLFLFSES